MLLIKRNTYLCIFRETKTMSNKEANEFVEKLNAGLELAEKRMLQEKSKRGESVVIYTEDKGIQHIPASIVIANNNIFQN